MPSPSLLGWCSTSISSIHKSVHELISNYTKTDVETSPYISAIQSLKGRTPGEKYRDLNSIIQRIVENTKERGEFVDTNEFREVSPAMTPLIRTIVGVELKLKELVVEGLQSDDVMVVDKALNADWFFNGANVTVNADYFKKHIMPFVSLRTRFKIIKKLSQSLIGHEKKAEEFFQEFIKLYGVDQSLTILTCCSETFIFNTILTNKIILPVKMVKILYRKNPNIAVRYLQLGNKRNPDNVEDRKIHEIEINDYDVFLPKLINNHPNDFVELYKITPEKKLQLGSTWAGKFLRNSREALIQEPQIFLKLLPLKLVSKVLRKEEFDTMFGNLFPEDIKDFNFDEMLDYLEFYPHGPKLQLLENQFEKIYNKNLFEESCTKSPKLLKILSPNERENRVKALLRDIEKNSESYDRLISYLPPGTALPYYKEKISKSTNIEDRIDFIGQMILCCNVYNNSEGLLDVLRYYNVRHRNEQNIVLCSFFEHLKQNFDLKNLDDNHWTELKSIINHAYVKNELFKSHVTLIESILEALLYHEICKTDNKLNIDKVIDLIIESKFTMSSSKWNVLNDNPEKERECMEKFFQLIPLKYPETDAFWRGKNNRLFFTLNVLKAVDSYNQRNHRSKISKKLKRHSAITSSETSEEKLNIEDYPWILKLAEEFFSKSITGYRKERLMKLLKRNAPDFYEAKMDQYSLIRDIESDEALRLLRQNPRKILANWSEYLSEAREKLRQSKNKAARRFVAATRWHHEIPVKFVEKCLQELGEKGSIEVLGILLEAEAFEKVITPFSMSLDEVDEKETKERYEMTRSILKAARFANPPVAFDIVAPYCRSDYVSLVDGTLATMAYRIPVNRVIEFTKSLVSKSISTRKLGVRLLQKVATKAQLSEFLEESWSPESNSSICQMEAKMIFNTFVELPSQSNYELVKSCINGLNIDDKSALKRFSDVDSIDTKYLSDYVDEYLKKIETLSRNGLDVASRTNIVCSVIESLNPKLTQFLKENTCLTILNRYFFDMDSIEISQAAQNFAIRSYLLPAEEKFENRLKSIMDVLTTVMERFDTPHPKKPRVYAANYTIHEFFADVLTEIACGECNHERSLTIIDNMLKVFNSILSPWQEPSSYLSLNLYKEYLLADSTHDFGLRCARRVSGLVEDFSANESIVNDVAKILNDFLYRKIYQQAKNPELKLSVIEGLMEGDDFYGAVISIKMLKYDEVEAYDERYDSVIKMLRQKQNFSVQYNLYKHLNRIRYNSDYM